MPSVLCNMSDMALNSANTDKPASKHLLKTCKDTGAPAILFNSTVSISTEAMCPGALKVSNMRQIDP